MWTVPPVAADETVSVDRSIRMMVTRREYPPAAGLRTADRVHQPPKRHAVRGWWRCLFVLHGER